MSLDAPPASAGGRPRFQPLRIAEVRREAEDAVSIAFDVPLPLRERFRFAAGQHLTVKAAVDGREVRRTYSIASGPDDAEWRIAVRHVAGGLFSAFANQTLKAGDVIDVLPPVGRFVLPAADGPRTIAAFAAGAGITPVISHIRAVLRREPDSRIFLFYGNRTFRTILFRAALEDMKDRYVDRLSIHNVLSREVQDVSGLNGRIDAEKIARFLRQVVPAGAVDHFLLCGPAPFLSVCVDALRALAVPDDAILVEHFTAPDGRPAPAKESVADAATAATAAMAAMRPSGGTATRLAVTLDGVTTELAAAPGERVLDAALAAGLDVPYSCRAGMCCTCRARLVDGAIDMVANYALRPDEIDAGFVLTCQSVPRTAVLAVDYDAS